MRSALFSVASALASARVGLAGPVDVAANAVTAASAHADSDLRMIVPEFVRYPVLTSADDVVSDHSNSAAAPSANVGSHNSNTTTCGAFESAALDTPMYVAVTAVFVVPKVSSRPLFDWTRDPDVTPRIAVSAGLDGIDCPEAVRAGIYATIFQNGTQQHVPFVEFSGHVYAVRIASVAPGEHVRVRVSIVQDDVVNINWSNLNRTDQAFNKNIATTGSMCGKSVTWFVEDLVPYKAGPGDFFAAFEPVLFRLLEGERIDGNTVRFDSSTANFTTEHALCKVDQSGTEMTVTSS